MSTEIFIIDPIDATHEGPEVPFLNEGKRKKGKTQLIHLQQGSLDGACGPYSLFMALIVCGLIDRNEITALNPIDKRTNIGRLFKNLESSKVFFRDGTDLKELGDIISDAFKKNCKSKYVKRVVRKT